MTLVRLAAIAVGGDAAPWEAIGFTAHDGTIGLANGGVTIDDPPGLVVHGTSTDAASSIEGVPIRAGSVPAVGEHTNGAVELDHVVLMTDSMERTSAAVAVALGLEQRRVRETEHVRQAFHRFADAEAARGCIIEIVERPGVEATAIWGLVVNVANLDAAVAVADGLVGQPKDAVQPGRRIATVSRAAGLPTAVALMSR